MTWNRLFERAGTHEVSTEDIRETLVAHRETRTQGASESETTPGSEAGSWTSNDNGSDDPPETADPTRIVADADVLAADLFVGGPARDVLDAIRSHSWLDLVVTEPLLADAGAVIISLGDESLAAEWREAIELLCRVVGQPPGDHPALAAAYRAGAAHLLTFDEDLTSARANLSMQAHLSVSVRTPAAFATLFDPDALYEATQEGSYPGPDREPE